jgi:hypothetical protein
LVLAKSASSPLLNRGLSASEMFERALGVVTYASAVASALVPHKEKVSESVPICSLPNGRTTSLSSGFGEVPGTITAAAMTGFSSRSKYNALEVDDSIGPLSTGLRLSPQAD